MTSPQEGNPNLHERATASQAVSPETPSEPLGQYLLLHKIGQGGMGTVYKAFHTRLKRLVALKILPHERVDDSQAVARFYREMQAVGQLDHPNIVRATDAGEAAGRHFLVMEFVDGFNLAKLVELCNPLGVPEACTLIRQAAQGLHYIQEQGLIHRDIKPSNLMLSFQGQVKILDLGLARFFDAAVMGEEVTPSGQVMGTADFMAPEQAHDSHQVDIQADIYSLGCTFFKLLTSRPPFAGVGSEGGVLKKIMAHAEHKIPDVTQVRGDIPPGVSRVLTRMLAKKPGDRPGPAETVAALEPWAKADLAALATRAKEKDKEKLGVFTPERETGWRERSTNPKIKPPSTPTPRLEESLQVSSQRWVWPALVALLVVTCATLAGLMIFRGKHEDEKPQAKKLQVEKKNLETSSNKITEKSKDSPKPLTPGRWHNVLAREPTKLYWPNLDSSFFVFNQKREDLLVSLPTPYMGLLTLGNISQGGYKFQIYMRQNKWVGGLGIFFGGHPDIYAGQPCIKVQTLEMVHGGRLAPPEKPIGFGRGVLRVYTDAQGNKSLQPKSYAPGHSVPLPTRFEELLEIEVSSLGNLQVARWANQTLTNITSLQASKQVDGRDGFGLFGIFTLGGTGTFRDARIFIDEGGN